MKAFQNEQAPAGVRASNPVENQYRRSFESSADAFCVLDRAAGSPAGAADFLCIDANAAFAELACRNDVRGKTLLELFPGHPQQWLDICVRALDTGEPQRIEQELRPGRLFEVCAFGLAGRQRTSVAAVCPDITSRNSEQGGHDSTSRLRAIFDGSYEFIGLLSPDGTVLEANRAALEWIGAGREEVIGRPFWQTPWWTHTPDAPDDLRQAIQRAAAGEFVRRDVTLHNPKGETAVFDFSLYPVRDESGRVTLIVPEGRNITHSITAAREIQRRYRDGLKLTAINRTLVGTFDFDQVSQIICSAARELIGADGATFVVREGGRVRYAAEDSIAPLWKGRDFPIECCISGWSMLHAEPAVIADIYLDARVPHEAYRPTFVRSLLMTPVGPATPVAAIGVYWAHERKATDYEVGLLQSLASAADLALAGFRAYAHARSAWAEAEQANRLKDEFLATLSHELRNPLNSIAGYSEILLRSTEAKQHPLIRHAAEAIHANAQAQAQLIGDLLDLSRLQTGKLAIDRRPFSLLPVVAEAVETARAQAVERQIALDVDLPAEPLLVNADHVRVRQIVWNLVNNALKFTAAGGRVLVSLRPENGRARLVVEDNGQGIQAEFQPHVFEMFRQGDAGTTRMHGGLGIGLAIVRQLVELHGGEVEAHSDGPGRGARFVIYLPLENVSPGIRSAAAADVPAGALTGARILVVDDTEDSVEMLGLLLTSEGASVVTALSGPEALKNAAASDFNLVFSDISMPGMDGYDFMRALREMPRYLKTPAIALTGFGREQDVERARRAGFTTHLTKPLDFAQLLKLARTSMANAGG